MKRLIATVFALLIFSACFAQRYQVWVETSNSENRIKGNYGFSNDSTLMTFSRATLLIPSKNTYFNWDDVSTLKVRNKSKNQLGQIIGASIGILASGMIAKSLNKSTDNENVGGLSLVVTLPILMGGGALIGHLATSKKTDIPVHGLNAMERNQLLNKTINE